MLTVVEGQTIGKMVFGLRVIGRNGGLVSIGASFVSVLHTMISLGLFGVGVLWMFINKKGCTWYDRLSDNRVVPT